MTLTVEDADRGHFMAAFDDIRRADMAEWFAGTGELFHVGAIEAVESSEVSKVALDEGGRPLVFWGGTGGRVWLFASEIAVPRSLSLHRILRPWLDDLHGRWPLIYAVADKRNVVHHKWMRWLGFSSLPEVYLPPFYLPFIVFTREDQPCASQEPLGQS
jgi:hypothetical protein